MENAGSAGRLGSWLDPTGGLRASVVVAALLAIVICGADARADHQLHAGLDLRTDQRAHPVRLPLGARVDQLDVRLVVDPMVFFDGQHDGDLVLEWHRCGTPLALLAGWRTTAFAIDSGVRFHQTSLLGVTTALGSWRAIQARFGAELSIHWGSHGAGVPSRWLGLDAALNDRLQLGVFVRVEYAR